MNIPIIEDTSIKNKKKQDVKSSDISRIFVNDGTSDTATSTQNLERERIFLDNYETKMRRHFKARVNIICFFTFFLLYFIITNDNYIFDNDDNNNNNIYLYI